MKKKSELIGNAKIPKMKKLFRMMKLTSLLLLISVTWVFANETYSQTKTLNLSMEKVTVKEVLSKIEDQSEFYFMYSSKFIDVNRKVTVNVKNKKIGSVLDLLLAGTNVSYTIKDKFIVLTTPELAGVEEIAFQQKSVSGKVTDSSGSPLPGVTVLFKGTTQGTTTNADGKYSLANIPEDATLQFSFVGMRLQEVKVENQTNIDVTMVVDAIGIDEVVAIGYGTMRKSDLTGSVAQVKTENLESVPVYNMEQALKSQAAGVSVRQNSGRPGGRIEVNIRGGNSMIGNNQPLYVIDGFPVTGDVSFINPSDIESVDILKDASATAIYGARGANGVVLITSKRGISGQEGKIEINSLCGVQVESNRYEMLDAEQYAEVANVWLVNSGQEPYFDLNQVQNPGTDWQDFIFRNAMLNNHTITFSGSNEKSKFSLSGNFYDQRGIIKYSGVRRGSFRLNLDHEFNNIVSLAINLNMSRSEHNSIPTDNSAHGGSMLSGAMAAPPTLSVYDENDEIVRIAQVYSFGSIGMNNPAIYFPPYKSRSLNNTIVGNAAFNINIANGLSLKSRFGLEYENGFGESYVPLIFSGDTGSASQSNSFHNSMLIENILTYIKTFSDRHSVNLMGGYTYQTNMYRNFGVGVRGFSNNTTEDYNLGAAEIISTPSSGFSEWTLASWLTRGNYSFDNKYMITASVRADGSSRFGKNHKWGIFPSGAIAWRISEESFMKSIDFINSLKLRASYGITGNTALSPYQSLNRLSSVKYIYGNQADVIGYIPSGIANSDLKWESTAQLDIGFDLSIMESRYSFMFDYYKKNTTDLLASVPLAPSVGFGSSLQNIGEIQNEGLEFSLSANILQGEFKWNASAQLSANRNKVIKLAGGSDIYGGGVHIFGNISLAREGEPLGVFYGLLEDGLDEEGYIKYVDLNKDGAITVLDRTIIGNPHPDFLYGFNSNFSYKNFALDIFLEGSYGNDIWWATAATHLNSFQRGSNQFAALYGNYWTTENPNPNAKYPKVASDSQISDSDRFVKDGSYLRLKSLRLAYNLPTKKLGLPWFDVAQIYLSGTNLFTLTNYPGIDPDVNTAGTDSQSISTRLTTGVDESAYPICKVYSIGLKLNF